MARPRWGIESGRATERPAERQAESAFAFELRRPTGEQIQTIVEYEKGARHGSLEAARGVVDSYVKRRTPPPLILVDRSGIPRADYEGLDWTAEDRARLVEHRLKASESFDRMVLALAGGALGLTLTFIHDIAPHPRHLSMIYAGWSLLAASLLFILVSYLTSIAAHDQIIDQMDERVASVRRPRRWTTWLNRSAAGLLVAGVSFVVLFACFNLGHVEQRNPGAAGEGIRARAHVADAPDDRRRRRAGYQGKRARSATEADKLRRSFRAEKLGPDAQRGPASPRRARGADSSETANCPRARGCHSDAEAVPGA